MTNPKLTQKIRDRFDSFQKSIINRRQIAYVGDSAGNVAVVSLSGYVWVRIGDTPAIPILNKRVSATAGMPVYVGYDPNEPNLYQVLGSAVGTAEMGASGVNFTNSTAVGKHDHSLLGNNPDFIEKRRMLPGRIGPAVPGSYSTGSAVLGIWEDRVFVGGQWKVLVNQTLDLTSHIPGTAGHSRYVAITVDSSANPAVIDGADIATLIPALTDVPAVPAGTVLLGFVRLYNGMTALQDGWITDILDVRTMTVLTPPGLALVMGAALPHPIGTPAVGVSGSPPHEDHVHGHGNLLGGTLHALATSGSPGFMPALSGSPSQYLNGNGAWSIPPSGSSSGSSHSPVTLDTNFGAIFGLTGQQLTVNSQAINKVLASPSSGSPGPLVVRSLVAADIPGGISPVKASGAELDTGTDDAKFATAKALVDSHNVPSVIPSTSGNVLMSNGTDWLSAGPAGSTPLVVTKVARQTRTVLYDNTLSSPGNWDVSGIDQTYDHLELIYDIKAYNASVNIGTNVTINNDTTDANYQRSYHLAGTDSASGEANDRSLLSTAAATNANYYGSGIISIIDYTKSDRYKNLINRVVLTYASGAITDHQGTMTWKNTAAISRIALAPSAGTTYAIGSRLQIIGIKAEYIVIEVAGSSYVAPHAFLDSAYHSDTLTGSVVDGSLIMGNVTPKWSALAIAIPAANVRNVLGIDNGETRPSWKTALDATNPATLTAAGAAAAGTSLLFAHRDHAHAITASLGWIGNGASQYQVPVTGATPFAPVWSGFLLDGTTGGKTSLAVTSGKTLTLTAVDNFNLIIPATCTVAGLGLANVFTGLNIFETDDYIRIRNHTAPRYRSDWFIHNVGGTYTTYFNSYDDTSGIYLPFVIDASQLSLSQGDFKLTAAYTKFMFDNNLRYIQGTRPSGDYLTIADNSYSQGIQLGFADASDAGGGYPFYPTVTIVAASGTAGKVNIGATVAASTDILNIRPYADTNFKMGFYSPGEAMMEMVNDANTANIPLWLWASAFHMMGGSVDIGALAGAGDRPVMAHSDGTLYC